MIYETLRRTTALSARRSPAGRDARQRDGRPAGRARYTARSTMTSDSRAAGVARDAGGGVNHS